MTKRSTVNARRLRQFQHPIGYQTSLMVYGPGACHFTNCTRIGIPMTLRIGLTPLLMAPLVWPF